MAKPTEPQAEWTQCNWVTLMSMERFSVVHQSVGKPTRLFFRGKRDLPGKGRGPERRAPFWTLRGVWRNRRVHSGLIQTFFAREPGQSYVVRLLRKICSSLPSAVPKAPVHFVDQK